MSPTVTFKCFCAVVAFSLLAAAGAPMSEEDVVRLFVSGAGVDELIERIESSEVAFDLSEEMLDELRAAGLPPSLIEAMRARQAAIEEATSPVIEEEHPFGASLRIRINPAGDDEERTWLRLIDLIDEATVERLRLRTTDPVFTDIAIFVACRTQDHVPHQWRGKTPLGRDFISAPRHRMLYFHSGAELTELSKWKKRFIPQSRPDGRQPGLLELELPPEIEVELEPDVAHDLTLGIALRTEERYYLIASDDLDGLVLQEEGRVLEVKVRGGKDFRRSSLKVRFHGGAKNGPG